MAITKPALSIFTGSKDLGTVFSEQNNINVKFFEINNPLGDTTSRISLQVGGKNRIIILQGAHDGEGFTGADDNAKLADFVYEMEEWINASIQTSKVYTDSLGNTYSVDAVDWVWTRSFDDPYRILYTLMMKED